MSRDHRLAVYGSLAPGEANHDQLAGLSGQWRDGQVRGRLVVKGEGPDLGYLALVLDAAAPAVPIRVFESADLPANWSRLDAFEGDGYCRTQVTVATRAGPLAAWVYVDSG